MAQHYRGFGGRMPEVWVSEFGTNINGEDDLSDAAVLNDAQRVGFYTTFLNSACEAIRQHKLNVPVIFAWTWMDNFEWAQGYQVKYGMVHTDFKHGTLKRRLKLSAYWWSKWFLQGSRPLAT